MNVTASERSALIRLASTLPEGSEERRAILAGIKRLKVSRKMWRPGQVVTPTDRFYASAVGNSSQSMVFPGSKYRVIRPTNQWGMVRVEHIQKHEPQGPWDRPYQYDFAADRLEEVKGEKLASDLYIVIGNYGRGSQVLYPKTDAPKTYSRREAEKIVEEMNDAPGRGNRPGGGAHWHAKPLKEAERYISRYEALSAVERLRRDFFGYSEEDDDYDW